MITRIACIAVVLGGSLTSQQVSPSTSELIAHYSRVIQELRAADTSHLTLAQGKERTRLIEVLDRYRRTADFGRNTRYPGERKPYFVDDAGRRCAVAFLLDHSGMRALTREVNRTANHAWIAELAQNRSLLAWLDRSGLTLEEAGRIQGPGRSNRGGRDRAQPGRPPEPPVRPFDRDEWFRENFPERGQQDAVPNPGTTVGPATPPKPATRTGRGLSPAAPSGPETPRGMPLSSLPSQSWSTWWQWNREEFIHPKARRSVRRAKHGQTIAARRSLRVDKLFDVLTKQASDSNGRVRKAVAVAMGRLGDARSVPALLDMLDDPSLQVRHAAILALGGTGSSRAVLELLHIARSGRVRKTEAEISSMAQPLATIALGLARRYGSTVGTSALVHGSAFKTPKHRSDDMQLARLLYQVLSPEEDVAELARTLAEAKTTPLDLRCRALEVIPSAGTDRKALITLIRSLNGSRLEARRSSALALGWFDHRLALGPLMTTFELEGELLTRAFLLLSIGRQGSDAGRKFLLEQVARGRKTLRPWAAVGLGLSARKTGAFDDKEVHKAILAARRSERNRDHSGAYLIALGLLRDRGSVEMLLNELHYAKNSLIRMSAAEALVLVGPDVARPPLRKLLADDQCYVARSTYASILGAIGSAADAPLLAKALRNEAHPMTRDSIAAALGMLEAAAGFDALLPLLRDSSLQARTRARVIEGLGASLSRSGNIELSDLYQRANFLVFPGWLQAIGTVRL